MMNGNGGMMNGHGGMMDGFNGMMGGFGILGYIINLIIIEDGVYIAVKLVMRNKEIQTIIDNCLLLLLSYLLNRFTIIMKYFIILIAVFIIILGVFILYF